RDREIDALPSKVVGRRREGAPTPAGADVLLRTVLTHRMSERLRRDPPRRGADNEGHRPPRRRTKQTVRPSDAADRAWLQALTDEENRWRGGFWIFGAAREPRHLRFVGRRSCSESWRIGLASARKEVRMLECVITETKDIEPVVYEWGGVKWVANHDLAPGA